MEPEHLSTRTSQLLCPRLTFGCLSHTTGAGFGAPPLPTLPLLPAAAGSGLRGAWRGGGSDGTGQRPASETLLAGLKSSMPGWPALRFGGLVKYKSPVTDHNVAPRWRPLDFFWLVCWVTDIGKDGGRGVGAHTLCPYAPRPSSWVQSCSGRCKRFRSVREMSCG